MPNQLSKGIMKKKKKKKISRYRNSTIFGTAGVIYTYSWLTIVLWHVPTYIHRYVHCFCSTIQHPAQLQRGFLSSNYRVREILTNRHDIRMTSAREALTLYYCVLDYVVFSSSQRARLYWLRGRTDRLSRFYSSRVASISTSIYIYIYIYICEITLQKYRRVHSCFRISFFLGRGLKYRYSSVGYSSRVDRHMRGAREYSWGIVWLHLGHIVAGGYICTCRYCQTAIDIGCFRRCTLASLQR